MAQALSVAQALDKELRDHEFPSTIEGHLIVSENFSYLIDDATLEASGQPQPALLVNTPHLATLLEDEFTEQTGDLVLHHLYCQVTGTLANSGMGIFSRFIYNVNEIEIAMEDGEIVRLSDLT